MKKILKSVATVAGANLAVLWMAFALLSASFRLRPFTLWQFLGLAPSPPESPWLVFLAYTVGILSGPCSWLFGPDSTGTFFFVSLLNSAIWGVTFGLPLYVLKQRIHRRTV